MLAILKRGLRLLDIVIEWAVIVLMVSLVVIVSLQFVDRHFIDTGIAAPDQYARIALVWLTFIGFAIAVRAMVNIRVDLIDSHLPLNVRRVLEQLFDALLIVLLVVLVPGSWRLMVIGKDQELLGTVFTAAVPAAGVFIACVVMLLYVGVRLVAGIIGRQPPAYEEKK
jgi:TRAP-type C4-dicarboxylate transport system permease small subunit